nr:transporter substrate-binding domain-containing protein [uncultured Rhodoferax sp.]
MLRRILLLLIAATCPLAHAGDAPTNVLVLTGGVVGVSATESPARTAGYGRELISKLMQDAGLSYTMEPQPFARALRTLETQPNAVLFPMLRTAERESKYQWVGLMAKRNYYLYRLDSRKDIVIQSLEDARQYRIGVLRGDVRTDYLRAQGFAEGTDKGLEVVNVAFSLLKMQQAGRIDLIVFSDEGIRLVCEEAKVACDAFTPAFRLDLVGNLWLAASPLMPPALLSTLRKAFQKQEDSGYLAKLMKSGRPVGG